MTKEKKESKAEVREPLHPTPIPMENISVSIPPWLHDRLKMKAKDAGKRKSYVIREALASYLR